MESKPRPSRPQAVMQVMSRTQLSPHLVRVVLGGDGFADFSDNDFTDKYVKFLIADPAHGLTPPYDLEAIRAERPDALPTRRTYTARSVDHEARELTVDFVVHGDDGVAGPWAATAEPGDVIVLSGAGGAYRPDPTAPHHLFVGDLSAIPAIASALEALPADAVGTAVIRADDPADRIPLTAPEGVEVRWVSADGDVDPLLEAVAALDWDEPPHAFVHGERGSVKALRRHLTDERSVPRENLSISAYWALGRAEDTFQAEKKEEVGQI